MCGRFSLAVEGNIISNRFNTLVPVEHHIRHNIAPTQFIPTILNVSPKKISMARWGFESDWTNSPLINARSEEIEKSKTFGNAYMSKRCIVLADSYYEWANSVDGKIPYKVMLKSKEPFGIAGVWEERDGKKFVAMITVKSNNLLRQINHRMPAIIKKGDESNWLKYGGKEFLSPYLSMDMEYFRISKKINSPFHDQEEFIMQSGQTTLV